MRIAASILLLLISLSVSAADKYFKPVSGNLWDTEANWFTDSTFTTSTTVPWGSDNVFFTYSAGNEANCVISAASKCLNLNMRGYRGVLTSGPSILFCSGDATLLNYNGRITMEATSGTKTIIQLSATNPVTYLVINGSGGTFDLGSDITISTTLTFTNGVFNANNYTITTGTLELGSGTKTFNGGSSTIILTADNAINFQTNAPGFTFNSQNSTFQFNSTGILNFGPLSYNIIKIMGVSATITSLIADSLIITPIGSTVQEITLAGNVTVSGALIIKPLRHTVRALIKSNRRGTKRTITLNGTLNISDCDFMDITFAGSNNWSGGHHIGDAGGNSTVAPNAPFDAARILYLRPASGTSINWTDTTSAWSTSTSGTPKVVSPLPQDSVVIDDTSIPSTSLTVHLTSGIANYMPLCKSINAGSTTKTLTLNKVTSILYLFGSFAISSSTSITGTSIFNFYARGSNNSIDLKGKTIGTVGECNFTGYNTTYNLLSEFAASTSDVVLTTIATACTLSASNNNITLAGPLLVNGLLSLGSGNVTISSSTHPLTASANSISAGTSTFIISGNPLTSRKFSGGGNTFYNVYFTGHSTSATNKWVISGNNTFNELKFRPSTAGDQRIDFTAGTTQTVGKFIAEVPYPYYLYMASTSTSAYTITKTTSGCSPNEIDRVDVSYMTGTPVNTWKMGTNSVDSGNNTNLSFEACAVESNISKVNSITFGDIKAVNVVDPATISKINNTTN